MGDCGAAFIRSVCRTVSIRFNCFRRKCTTATPRIRPNYRTSRPTDGRGRRDRRTANQQALSRQAGLRGVALLDCDKAENRAFSQKNISEIWFIWKPCIFSFKWGMVALYALGSGCVAAQNVEVTCMRPAQLRKQENNTKLKVVLNVINQLYFNKMCVSC